MKRKVWTLFLGAAILCSLAACGSAMTTDDATRDKTPYINGVETPAEKSGKSAMEKSGRTVEDAAKRAGEDMKETLKGESWKDMLRNGRVRDTDGKLKDGENALHGRYGVQK